MNPTYGADAAASRETVQAFLAEKLPSDWEGIGTLPGDGVARFVTQWRTTLYEAGYLAPGRPARYGGAGLAELENARVGTIYAGSSEVQRDILREMVLGLLKEPRPA